MEYQEALIFAGSFMSAWGIGFLFGIGYRAIRQVLELP